MRTSSEHAQACHQIPWTPALLKDAAFARAVALLAALAAYATLTAQDAAIRTTIAHIPPVESLCLRSIVTLALCLGFGGSGLLSRAVRSRCHGLLVVRALLGVAAWICFFEANKRLSLATTTAVVLCAPLLLALFAPVLAHERTTVRAWCALVVGLLGMLLTTSPGGALDLFSIGLAAASAALWAGALLTTRRIARTESASVQLLYVNAGFIIVGCAVGPSSWNMPDLPNLGAILVAGVLGYVGQLCLVSALRRTTALDVAVMQYTGLIWALGLGYLMAGDLPSYPQVLGSLLVAICGGLITTAARNDRFGKGLATRSSIGPVRSDARDVYVVQHHTVNERVSP